MFASMSSSYVFRLAVVFSWLCLLATSRAGETGLDKLDFRETIQSAKEKVFPAVVFLKCLQESHDQGQKRMREVSGSGVLISPKGELLTNWHVVDKATEVRCLLSDGQAIPAKIVGSDEDTDLALVQLSLEEGKTVPFAALGDSTKLREGDFVMAMGAPWGLSRSVSIGIISCLNRYLSSKSEYSLWLQTDAAISPGNSGGPLVNTKGEVIGINTLGMMQGGDLGFAIPSQTISYIIPQLREYKQVQWSWTGLQLQPLKDFNRNIFFDGNEGVIVSETDPESPARSAGLLARDRILKINGESVKAITEEDLPLINRMLGFLPKFKPAKIEIKRGDELMTMDLTPSEKGKVEGEELDCPRWDFTVKAINQFHNPDLYFQKKKGIYIYGVKNVGNARKAGLMPRDILLTVDSKEIVTLDEMKTFHKELLDNVQQKHRVTISVLRNGLVRQIVLDYFRDYEKE
jgi:serine protease Do